MKTYIKFFLIIFYKAFLYSTAITLSLVFIMSLLSELDFFKEINVNIYIFIIKFSYFTISNF